MKYVKPLNEAVRYVDRAGKPFNIKGINQFNKYKKKYREISIEFNR